MKITLLRALTLVCSAVVSAQSPLPTTYSGGNAGGPGWAVYFDITTFVPADLFALDVNSSSPAGTLGHIEVYLGPPGSSYSTFGPYSIVGASTPIGSMPTGTATHCALGGPVPLPVGSRACMIVFRGFGPAYSSGSMTFGNADMQIDAGAVSTLPFAGGTVFNPRVFNGALHYVAGPPPAVANEYGVRCTANPAASFYEHFDGVGSVTDLSNTSWQLQWNGGGAYDVWVNRGSVIVPPTGPPTPLAGNQTVLVRLPFSFPNAEGASRDRVWVCSNGFVALSATTSADATESPGELLAGPNRVCALWDDLNPSAGGAVHFEVDPFFPGRFHITFANVPQFGQLDSNTFQVSIEHTGDITVNYGRVDARDSLVGYARGGGARDPGGIDISGTARLALGDDGPGLGLVSVSPPVGRGTACVRMTEIPSGSSAAAFLLGDAASIPGVPLGAIGMTGCELAHNANLASLPFAPSGRGELLRLPIGPGLAGLRFYLQGVALAPGSNPFGVIASNGVEWVVGSGAPLAFQNISYPPTTVVVDYGSHVAGQSVVLSGGFSVGAGGVANGMATATFSGGSSATVIVNGLLGSIATAGTVIDLDFAGPPDTVLVGGAPTPIGSLVTTFAADFASGTPPGLWSPTSRALFALASIAETPGIQHNIGQARLQCAATAPWYCKAFGIAFSGAVAVAAADGCAGLARLCGPSAVGTVGGCAVRCAPLVRACYAGALNPAASAYRYFRESIWGS